MVANQFPVVGSRLPVSGCIYGCQPPTAYCLLVTANRQPATASRQPAARKPTIRQAHSTTRFNGKPKLRALLHDDKAQ